MALIIPSRRDIAPKNSEFEIDWSRAVTRGLYFFANLGAGTGAPIGFDGSRTTFTFGSVIPQSRGYGQFTNHVVKLDKSVPAGGLASVLCKFKGYTSGNGRLVDCDYDSGVWLGPAGSGTFGGGFSVGGSPYGQYTSPDLTVPNVIGLVRTGTTASLSLNGVEVSTQSNPNAWTSGNRIAIGGTAAGASERIVADIEWVALWTRPLTAAETLAVSRDPYGILLKPRRRRTWFLKPSAASPTRDIAGSGSFAFAGSADLSVTRQIAGTGSAAFSGTAEILVTRAIAGSGSASFGGTAEVTVTRDIAGTAAAAFGGSSEIVVTRQIEGTAAVAFGGTATVTVSNVVTRDISGSGSAAFGGSAEILVTRAIAGSAAVIFSGSGQLIVTRQIAGAGSVVFTGTATVTNSGGEVAPGPVVIHTFPMTIANAVNTARVTSPVHRARLTKPHALSIE